MQTLLTTTVFSLNPGEVTALSMHAAQRLFVEDAKGVDVWVTRENDSEDYWLRCGCSLLLKRGDEIVLSVDPRAAGPVRLALIAETRRPALTLADVPHLVARAARRLVRGTEWTPGQDKVHVS
ncbi:MAG: DUF2917 domain-containing protein [Cupriavidus sp.]|jgi:hypothetical protein|uniref:DUF2917 domain-containing protein n=1 Tax=Cupriavidus pauculus TaxID=82633 RepID=UPI0007806659|nr:DUF2917 domain-containing protein [Cupriavidus pauculus]MBU64527.1 DUF2917 domain-containing protein [Cupriavidus sp.]MBY4731580.1 DUF2917 domain-containing protein [Cupriavidus pauculus]